MKNGQALSEGLQSIKGTQRKKDRQHSEKPKWRFQQLHRGLVSSLLSEVSPTMRPIHFKHVTLFGTAAGTPFQMPFSPTSASKQSAALI